MSFDPSPATPLRTAVRQKLESLSRCGVTHIKAPHGEPAVSGRALAPGSSGDPKILADHPNSKANAPTPPRTSSVPLPQDETAVSGRALAPGSSAPGSSAAAPTTDSDSLLLVARDVAVCTLCTDLAATRTQTVPGVGNPQPRLMFLGEAPGADEDRQGQPFVGRAGQLLTQMIENGMGLKRSEVFIGNVLKCRPPGNRTPSPEEAANCRPFLERQIALLKPEFICCLGAVAAQNLLATDRAIGKLRGQIHDYRGAKVICTYHPAYLLRNPAAKKDTWADLQILMREMGLPVPGK